MLGVLLQAGISTTEIAKDAVSQEAVLKATGTLAGGIGSIFLLFVIFYYVTSILDGGKFQVKMLMPVLIYILACNFSWITGPVTGFTQGITSSLCSTFKAKTDLAIQNAGGESGDNIYDIYMMKRRKELETNSKKKSVERAAMEQKEIECATDTTSLSSLTESQQAARVMKERQNFIQRIADGIRDAINGLFGEWASQFSFSKVVDNVGTNVKYTLMGFLTAILCWVSNLMSEVLKIFGATMSGIIMALGPLTWAFAVFPGRGKTIETWFIRCCQFALWSPIAALITYLNTSVSCDVAVKMAEAGAGGGADGMFALCVSLVANIIALTAVPSIAQMVLEGASGNVALSGGLQQAAHAVTTASSIALMPATKSAQAATFLSGLSNAQSNRAQLANDKMNNQNISNKLDQIIQGQNPHK